MQEITDAAEKIALLLLEIRAIRINPGKPFFWASGWKSPIYCDNRLSLSYPSIRSYIRDELCRMVSGKFSQAEAIAGVATAGIPQGTLVADRLGLPFIYVRTKPKDHGLTNQIEGKVIRGQKIVVIEDLVSTGGSSMNAIEALSAAELNVLGMVSIFSYGFQQAVELFREKGIPWYSLSHYDILIEAALKENHVKPEEVDQLKAWRKDPSSWG
jgi:orotate phosphoribosyltransferase